MGYLYTTRKQAMRGCIMEAQWAEKAMTRALSHAAKGEAKKAWDAADMATCAAKCAMNAHDELWELAHGKLTEAEAEAFCAAEEAVANANKAVRASAEAVRKIQAEYDAQVKNGKRKCKA